MRQFPGREWDSVASVWGGQHDEGETHYHSLPVARISGTGGEVGTLPLDGQSLHHQWRDTPP